MTDGGRRDPIRMVAYRAAWAADFERERVRVVAALEPWRAGPVERIGSTAVLGLVAKPIIDMMVSLTGHRHGVSARSRWPGSAGRTRGRRP